MSKSEEIEVDLGGCLIIVLILVMIFSGPCDMTLRQQHEETQQELKEVKKKLDELNKKLNE